MFRPAQVSDFLIQHYAASPLLLINATDFDLAGDDSAYQVLLNYISSLPPGRHYFNPR